MAALHLSALNKAIDKILDSSFRALEKAEKICGSADILIKKIGVNKKCYDYWRNGATFVPYEVAMQIFVITGGKVSIGELRPDLKDLDKQYCKSLIKDIAKDVKNQALSKIQQKEAPTRKR